MTSKLPFGPGTKLWEYWTVGKGAAKWMSSPQPWTTLHAELTKYIGPEAAGLTTNVMLATPAGRALFKLHHGGHSGKASRQAGAIRNTLGR